MVLLLDIRLRLAGPSYLRILLIILDLNLNLLKLTWNVEPRLENKIIYIYKSFTLASGHFIVSRKILPS